MNTQLSKFNENPLVGKLVEYLKVHHFNSNRDLSLALENLNSDKNFFKFFKWSRELFKASAVVEVYGPLLDKLNNLEVKEVSVVFVRNYVYEQVLALSKSPQCSSSRQSDELYSFTLSAYAELLEYINNLLEEVE